MDKEIYGIEIFPSGNKKQTYSIYKLLTEHNQIEILDIRFIDEDIEAKFQLSLKTTTDSRESFNPIEFELSKTSSTLSKCNFDLKKQKLELNVLPIYLITKKNNYGIRLEYCEL